MSRHNEFAYRACPLATVALGGCMNRRRALVLVSTLLLAGCNGSASTGTGTDGGPSDDTSSPESGSSAPEAASEAGLDGTLAADSQPAGVDATSEHGGDAADGSPDSPDGYAGSFDASDVGVQTCADGGCDDGGAAFWARLNASRRMREPDSTKSGSVTARVRTSSGASTTAPSTPVVDMACARQPRPNARTTACRPAPRRACGARPSLASTKRASRESASVSARPEPHSAPTAVR